MKYSFLAEYSKYFRHNYFVYAFLSYIGLCCLYKHVLFWFICSMVKIMKLSIVLPRQM